ncbi:hypothetical protein ACO0R3_001423 [Hanseniaspora guilliermondii]
MSLNNNGSKILVSDNDLTSMFPYLKRNAKFSNSTLSNIVEMIKSLYEVSKANLISDESYEALDNGLIEPNQERANNALSIYNILNSNGFFFIFKFIFKYCLSKYVLICILNATLLSKSTYFSKKTVDFRRNSVRWQLVKQQLLARRLELLRTINDNQLPEDSPETFQVEQIDIQLAELEELEQNQLNLERQEIVKARDRKKYKKIVGILLHAFSITSMIVLLIYSEKGLFANSYHVDVAAHRLKLNQYADAVFFIINWLDLCLSINTQFDLLPHRKTILKYDGYNTFDYSVILFAATGFFNQSLIKEHSVLFKFFVYNKLCYESVTIVLEVLNLKYLWLYFSFFLDIAFSKWAFDIMSSGIFKNVYNLLDPFIFISCIEIYLLYLPTLISYGYAVICMLSLFYVVTSMGFKNLHTLNFFIAFKDFVNHVSKSEPRDQNQTSSMFFQVSKMNFSKLTYKFMLFTMRDNKKSLSTVKESSLYNAVKTTYDLEFSTINKRFTKPKGLKRAFNKHPGSLNEVYLDHLLLNVLDDKAVDIDYLNENAIDSRSEEISSYKGKKHFRGFKISNLLPLLNKKNITESFKFIISMLLNKEDNQLEQKEESKNTMSLSTIYKQWCPAGTNRKKYAALLLSDMLLPGADDNGEYQPEQENILETESDNDEAEDYDSLQSELDDLFPKFQEFVCQDLDDSKREEFELLTDIVKKESIFNKISQHFKLHYFTRSYYKKYLDDEVIMDVKHELKKRHNYYATLKDVYLPNETEESENENEQEDDFSNDCVVCTENKRTIILWPCKCFAICDDCRITLSEKNFAQCPCCRTSVHGYSKVNNV